MGDVKQETEQELERLLAELARIDVRAGALRADYERERTETNAQAVLVSVRRVLWESGVKA